MEFRRLALYYLIVVSFTTTRSEDLKLKISNHVFDSISINYTYHFLTSELINKKNDARILTKLEGRISDDSHSFWKALLQENVINCKQDSGQFRFPCRTSFLEITFTFIGYNDTLIMKMNSCDIKFMQADIFWEDKAYVISFSDKIEKQFKEYLTILLNTSIPKTREDWKIEWNK